jgi:hypothetical protein
VFFFEKKNQKTFAFLGVMRGAELGIRLAPGGATILWLPPRFWEYSSVGRGNDLCAAGVFGFVLLLFGVPAVTGGDRV